MKHMHVGVFLFVLVRFFSGPGRHSGVFSWAENERATVKERGARGAVVRATGLAAGHVENKKWRECHYSRSGQS